MFKDLRKGSTLFLLEKSEHPTLRQVVVDTVSQPRSKYGGQSVFNQFGIDTVIDITVKDGDEVLEFQQLDTALSIQPYSEGRVISDSREAMLAEVESMHSTSTNIINSVEYHEHVKEACEGIMQQLNPQLAERQEQEKRLDALDKRMDGMESSIQEMLSLLKSGTSKT